MGNKFVTIDENGIVLEPYDEDNGNVPDGAIPITDDELSTLRERSFGDYIISNGILSLSAESLSSEYKRNRKTEYPPIQDQLDMIYWDKVNATNDWQTLIQSIKTKYPKP